MLLDEVIERDGPECVWCGATPWRRDLTFEHVLPRSRGGRAVPANGLVACRRCNKARGSRPPVAYVRALHDAGTEPHAGRVLAALQRMRASDKRAEREYGARQAQLLERALQPAR